MLREVALGNVVQVCAANFWKGVAQARSQVAHCAAGGALGSIVRAEGENAKIRHVGDLRLPRQTAGGDLAWHDF